MSGHCSRRAEEEQSRFARPSSCQRILCSGNLLLQNCGRSRCRSTLHSPPVVRYFYALPAPPPPPPLPLLTVVLSPALHIKDHMSRRRLADSRTGVGLPWQWDNRVNALQDTHLLKQITWERSNHQSLDEWPFTDWDWTENSRCNRLFPAPSPIPLLPSPCSSPMSPGPSSAPPPRPPFSFLPGIQPYTCMPLELGNHLTPPGADMACCRGRL